MIEEAWAIDFVVNPADVQADVGQLLHRLQASTSVSTPLINPCMKGDKTLYLVTSSNLQSVVLQVAFAAHTYKSGLRGTKTAFTDVVSVHTRLLYAFCFILQWLMQFCLQDVAPMPGSLA